MHLYEIGGASGIQTPAEGRFGINEHKVHDRNASSVHCNFGFSISVHRPWRAPKSVRSPTLRSTRLSKPCSGLEEQEPLDFVKLHSNDHSSVHRVWKFCCHAEVSFDWPNCTAPARGVKFASQEISRTQIARASDCKRLGWKLRVIIA